MNVRLGFKHRFRMLKVSYKSSFRTCEVPVSFRSGTHLSYCLGSGLGSLKELVIGTRDLELIGLRRETSAFKAGPGFLFRVSEYLAKGVMQGSATISSDIYFEVLTVF